MKCIDCKIIKFDGQKYSCPAHPYVEGIDVYTEHRNCNAMRWYPQYLKDRICSIEENFKVLEAVLLKIYPCLEELKQFSGYGELIRSEIRQVYEKYVRITEDMDKIHRELIQEQERLDEKDLRLPDAGRAD